MFRLKIFFLALILIICLSAITSASISEIQREIIVMFKPGVISLPEGSLRAPLDSVLVTSSAVQSALTQFNPELILKGFPEHDPADTIAFNEFGQLVKKLDLSRIYKIRLPEGINRDSLITILNTIPEVVYAEPNATVEFLSPVFPDDQYFGNQWGLYNTGQFGGTYRADIHAPEAWEIFKGSSSIKIGIIDTGVDGAHPDLSGKVSGDASYYDDHGTHVAGIATAKTNNSIGVAGVDWNAQIISQQVYWSDATEVYNAIVDAVNLDAFVINNSWRWPEGYSATIRSAFAYAYKMNRVATAAMGNDGEPKVNYPAAFGQGIIAVGATNDHDQLAYFSTTGNHIDVSAPGYYIYSTLPETYDYKSGTSMATPFVTGLASLLKGYKNDLYNDDIEQIIKISSDRIRPDLYPYDENGWNINVGTGRINAQKALELLRHPNYFAQVSTSGAYRAGNTGVYSTVFFDTPGLAPGVYLVKRYEARKDITLPREFWSANYVWGRGVSTNGYSAASANFGMGFCDAVAGSITSTTATLYSYVYEVWTLDGDYVGWVPCEPEDVSFAYSVLGEPKLLASTASGVVSSPTVSPYIRASWTDPNINELGYKVERKDATNNEWSEKASLDSNYTAWTDTVLVGSETYTYRVKSHNIHQVSEYSNEKVFKARPNAPNDFEALVECMGGTSKAVPSSSDPQSSPPTLYSDLPPGGCQKTNQVFLYWSPPVNQKLNIDYYKVKIVEWGGPTTYEGPIYGLADTLCLETLTSYNLYVYAVDAEGDEGYYSSVQTITTGHRNMCPDYPNKPTANTNLPEDFFLGQNYPNPFNAQTQIEYGLPEDCDVKLIIYNILGEKVRVLIDEFQNAGVRNIFWDGKNDQGEKVASGIYLYQLKAGTFSKTAKLNFLK